MTRDVSQPVKRLLTVEEAARYLSLCTKSLWSLSAPRGPIATVRIGKAVRYDPADLEKFIESRKAAAVA